MIEVKKSKSSIVLLLTLIGHFRYVLKYLAYFQAPFPGGSS